jgi:hypothetical protein
MIIVSFIRPFFLAGSLERSALGFFLIDSFRCFVNKVSSCIDSIVNA